MTNYEVIIGMEVHAELLTKSKVFCGCDAQGFGAPPNSYVCPVCLGMPGVLPVINRRAVEQTIMVGLALHCEIAETAVFSRKNYFYPDLPKAYQISMYDFPLCQNGWIEIDDPAGSPGAVKRIAIRRVHLEEETAKLTHAGDYSLVDFNRAGRPLIEIVTEPDIRTPEEARQYLIKLQAILRYLSVSTGDMEKGAMRCEPNISLRPVGIETFGTKVEIKNLNSFRSVQQALAYEIERQAQALDSGTQVRQVTMGWDEGRGCTVEQRVKEESDDYRYFPEPDLPPLRVSRSWVAEIGAALPELPDSKRERFVAEYGLSQSDAAVIVADRDVAVYFEDTVAIGQKKDIAPRTVGNWVTGELFRLLKAEDIDISQVRVAPEALADLIALVEEGTITANSSKVVFGEMFATGQPPEQIVEARSLAQVSDQDALAEIVVATIAANPEQVAKYRAGKETLLQWFVGQVMRATRGKANHQIVTELFKEKLQE
jgi:aspartyl-tRNA(Asn)/glutamyl-tRNA(Gln) amidotransferase subunit B